MAEDERRDEATEGQEPEAEVPEAPEAGDAQADQPAEPPAEEPPAEEAPVEEAPEAAVEEPPVEEDPGADQPAVEEAPPAAEEAPPPAEEAPPPAAEEAPPAEAEAPAEPAPAPEQRRPRRERDQGGDEVIPGAHLEPDLVLEEERRREADEEDIAARYAAPDVEAEGEVAEVAEVEAPEAEPVPPQEQAPAPRTPLDLAADARYQATGKRKTSVARVILKPGSGSYRVNGRELDEYFPRALLQKTARQPLESTGNEARMDVVAKIHGGGMAAQAGALRHGIARALIEADPALRTELKRRGYLTRDARAKERKKAGLKKARKRPQFSKR